MARRGRSSIYVTTNPNVPISIGTPGHSIFIGTPGPTIYGPGGNPPVATSGVLKLIGAGLLTLIPSTAVLSLEF